MHRLNNEQQRVKQAIELMRGGDRLIVSGRAGSGKTYAIANSVTERKALFLAPTHPARIVLEQELPDRRHKVTTIHSAIGWYRARDENLDDVDFYCPARKARRRHEREGGKNGLSLFADADIIIVDEFSMVGSFYFRAIEEYAEEFDLPVVYSGDRYQLPPVEDREVIMDQGFETIMLERSMRFSAESEIYQLGEMLRDWIEHRPDEELPSLFGGATVQVLAGHAWMDALIRDYQDCGNLLAVTSDNKTLLRLRNKVRYVNHDRLIAGDLVISKQTDEVFRNGEQFTIRQIDADLRMLEDVPRCVSSTGKLSLRGYAVSFLETDREAFIPANDKDAGKLSSRIRRLHDKGKLDRTEAIRMLDWLEQPNSFELSALATAHKSQGRSVDTVYIDTNTVLQRPAWLSPKNHKRLLYTAITRARERVVLYEMASCCKPKTAAAAAADTQAGLVLA